MLMAFLLPVCLVQEVELYEGFFEDADGKQWYRNAEGCYWPCDDEGHVLLSDSDAEVRIPCG